MIAEAKSRYVRAYNRLVLIKCGRMLSRHKRAQLRYGIRRRMNVFYKND